MNIFPAVLCGRFQLKEWSTQQLQWNFTSRSEMAMHTRLLQAERSDAVANVDSGASLRAESQYVDTRGSFKVSLADLHT